MNADEAIAQSDLLGESGRRAVQHGLSAATEHEHSAAERHGQAIGQAGDKQVGEGTPAPPPLSSRLFGLARMLTASGWAINQP